MQVTKITGQGQLPEREAQMLTEEQLANEYNYIRAGQITRKMMDEGLISAGEYERIMVENRRTFSPYLADLYPDHSLI